MPLLGALLVSLFGQLAGFFATYVTKKAANVAAFVTLSLALTAALWTALLALIAGVSWPSLPGVATGLYLANAGAFAGLVSTVIATEVSITAYRYNLEAAKIVAVS